jgi:hypothetical protein
MIAQGTNLFYSSARIPTVAGDSSLETIAASTPLTHTPVPTRDTIGPLSPRILGKDEGLLFLALDETGEGRDLNNDGDLTDTAVVALLDATTPGGVIRSTELAVPGDASPFRARRTAPDAHDWQVGFLVSEAAQGASNLNDPALFSAAWKAAQCTGFEDNDALDDVLHFLFFAAWDANPAASPPVNTGLVGERRIVIVENASGPFVGVVSPESSEGTCDLNQDGDRLDHLFRWTAMSTPVLPFNSSANLHALVDPPGGTHGAAELSGRFVILVSESEDNRDINGDGLKTFDLLGWASPSASPAPWDFTHGATNSTFVGATWMREQPDSSRLNVAFPENVGGVNLNAHNPPLPGEDTDLLDSVPTFATFAGSPAFLTFPGVAIAVDHANAGQVIAGNIGFYRVSEVEDSRDWNGDGDELDTILFGTSLTSGISAFVGDLNTIAGRSAIEVDPEESPAFHAAFVADERMQNVDLNGDGDALDLVATWFVLGADCNHNGVPDDVDISNGTSLDQDGDGIPDECESTGTAFCFGDGSGAACPCGPVQNGGPGEGCLNSAGSGGKLGAHGIASVGNDTLTLVASGMPGSALALYFQGTTATARGLGVLYGDGLSCAGGAVIRLGTKDSTNGSSTFGAGSGSDPSISTRGRIPAAGGVRTYQAFYRDGAAFCTPAAFNLTNGVRIVWSP